MLNVSCQLFLLISKKGVLTRALSFRANHRCYYEKKLILWRYKIMKMKLMTPEAIKEIESLIPDHEEALMRWGAQMYREGIVKGAILVGTGMMLISKVSRVIKVIQALPVMESPKLILHMRPPVQTHQRLHLDGRALRLL